MTALRFQTGAEHQTSPASLRGENRQIIIKEEGSKEEDRQEEADVKKKKKKKKKRLRMYT